MEIKNKNFSWSGAFSVIGPPPDANQLFLFIWPYCSSKVRDFKGALCYLF